MIEYDVKTWGCDCGYCQDFDSNTDMHTKIHEGIPKNVCPSCKKKYMRQLDVPRFKHSHLEKSDVDEMEKEWLNEQNISEEKIKEINNKISEIRKKLKSKEEIEKIRLQYEHK